MSTLNSTTFCLKWEESVPWRLSSVVDPRSESFSSWCKWRITASLVHICTAHVQLIYWVDKELHAHPTSVLH